MLLLEVLRSTKMNLIDLSIKRPVFAWVIMFALIIFGAITVNKMGVSQLPDVDFPIINVSFSYEGAAPEVVESELVVWGQVKRSAFFLTKIFMPAYAGHASRIMKNHEIE